MRFLIKSLKWLFLTILLLALLSAALAFYLLGTESGYRQVPKLLNQFTPFQLSYETLEGKLWGRQQWRNLHLTGPEGLDFRAEALIIDFAGNELFGKRLHLPLLQLSHSTLHLPQGDNSPSEEKNHASLERLPEIQLPLQIDIDALRLSELEIRQGQEEIITLHDVQGALHGQDSALELTLHSALSQGKTADTPAAFTATADVSGNLRLSGAYPLTLKGEAQLQLPEKAPQEFALEIGGSLLQPALRLQAEGWLQASVEGAADIDLAAKTLTSELHWQDIALSEQDIEIPQGNIALSGAFEDLHLALDSQVRGKEIPDLKLSGNAHLSPQALRDVHLLVNTLGGSIDLQGFAEFGEGLNWQADLRVQNLDARQYDAELDAALNAHIHTQGQQSAAAPLSAEFAIAQLSGHWQQYPIAGSGDVRIEGSDIHVRDLLLNLADNRVAVNGQANAQEIDLQAEIDATALGRLLPNISGAVQGAVHVSGAAANPAIEADLQWKDLLIQDNKETLVQSSAGAVQAQGNMQDLRLTLQGKAQGRDFPALDVAGTAVLAQLQAVKDIDLVVNTMEGKVALTGEAAFAPEIAWDVTATLEQLRPKYYLPDMQAQISAQLQATGGIDAQGNLHTQADVRDLSGTWQGQKLAGDLTAQVQGSEVKLEHMDVQVGDNRISGQVQLQEQALQGDIELQALNLAQLHPQLHGVLRGSLNAGGSAQSPVVKANLKGEQLAFADNRVAAAEIVLDTGLQAGAAFNNQIVLSGIEAAGQKWSALRLDTQGTYQEHRLTLKSEGGEYNLNLQAAGGFSALDAWAGQVNQLEAQVQDLRWQLRRPTQIAISPREVSVRDACLADQYSAFCLNLAHQEQTSIDYAIDQIDPRSFAAFIPENVKLDTLLKGEGKLNINAQGVIRGQADLRLTPGSITAQVEGQPPIVLKLKEAVLNTQFNEQRSRSLLNIDFIDTGNVRADVVISNFQNPQLSGNLTMSIPDIGKFQHFIPQVSELKGRVQGDLQFSGPLSQPQASGELRLENGALQIPEYATDLKDIRLRLSARRDGNIAIDGNIGTPKGSLQADGLLRLQPLNLNLKLNGKDMLLANSKEMRLLVTPRFDIRIDPNSGVIIKGDVLIPEAEIAIPDTRSAVAVSEDVVIVNNQTKDDAPYVSPAGSPLQADIALRLGDKVFYKDPNMNIRLMGAIDVLVRPAQPIRGRGRIEVASGYYELYGQELNIQRGWVTFSDDISNPSIDIIAMRKVENVEAGARISGSVKRMRLDLTSDPAMPDSAVLSYLIFGRAPDSGTDSTALLQTAAVIGTKRLFPDDLAQKTGLDVFNLGVGGLKAGKYLMEDLYVGMKSDFFSGLTRFLARYQITDRLSVEASSSQLDGNAVDVIYEFETD